MKDNLKLWAMLRAMTNGEIRRFLRIVLVLIPMGLLAWVFDTSEGPALVDQWGWWGTPVAVALFVLWGLIVFLFI